MCTCHLPQAIMMLTANFGNVCYATGYLFGGVLFDYSWTLCCLPLVICLGLENYLITLGLLVAYLCCWLTCYNSVLHISSWYN